MKRRIFISAGHCVVNGKDAGATAMDNQKEGLMTAELRKLVVKELLAFGVFPNVDNDSFVTYETVNIIKDTLEKDDVAVDIHFNAYGNSLVRGTEVLVPFNYSRFELRLAGAIATAVSKVLETKNRGVKTEANSARGTLMFMRPNCENILIEICFITNKEDLDAYNNRKLMVAKVVAAELAYHLNIPTPEQDIH